MARTKKVVEEVVQDIVIADCRMFVSISFDRNNNLYGITKEGALFSYDWANRKWVEV